MLLEGFSNFPESSGELLVLLLGVIVLVQISVIPRSFKFAHVTSLNRLSEKAPPKRGLLVWNYFFFGAAFFVAGFLAAGAFLAAGFLVAALLVAVFLGAASTAGAWSW